MKILKVRFIRNKAVFAVNNFVEKLAIEYLKGEFYFKFLLILRRTRHISYKGNQDSR
jgi:hypothetical protein